MQQIITLKSVYASYPVSNDLFSNKLTAHSSPANQYYTITMGFFKSNKEPQPPLPSLSLHLTSKQDTVFKPNDTVSGYIEIATPLLITPQAIEVTLWGESKTWIRTSSSHTNGTTGSRSSDYRHYRDNAPFFNLTSNLLPNATELVPGRINTFPFSFRVPEGTGINRSGCYQDDTDARWTVFPHNLPPTFFVGTSPDDPDNCEISYGVTARLICFGVGVGKDLEPIQSTAPILFQPLNLNASTQGPLSVLRYPKTFTLSSSALTGLDVSSIGFRQRMTDRFSSATPKLDFELGIEIPDFLTSGSEFRFRTTLDIKEKSEKVTLVPEIRFKVLKLELLDFTFYRAPRDWEASNTMSGYHHTTFFSAPRTGFGFQGQEDTVYREKKTALNSLPDLQVIELPEMQVEGEKKGMEQAQHCEHWWTGRIPGFMPPTFISFAIARMYRVKVKMGMEVGGKKFEFEAESHVKDLGSVVGQNGV